MLVEPYRGPERRKTPRKKVEADVEYLFHVDLSKRKKELSIDKSHSLNIGGGGLCIYSDNSEGFEVGNKVYLTITLPKSEKKIFALCKVIYAVRVDQGPGRMFKVGFGFLTIEEEDKRIIMDFVSE